jgi:hypothetical protein
VYINQQSAISKISAPIKKLYVNAATAFGGQLVAELENQDLLADQRSQCGFGSGRSRPQL